VWQGWVVLIAYFVGFAAAYLFILPRNRTAAGVVIVALTVAFILACYLKGEPQSRSTGNRG
jgi:asparagine N-glycosylation enzyme membrane subunit Stt3